MPDLYSYNTWSRDPVYSWTTSSSTAPLASSFTIDADKVTIGPTPSYYTYSDGYYNSDYDEWMRDYALLCRFLDKKREPEADDIISLLEE